MQATYHRMAGPLSQAEIDCHKIEGWLTPGRKLQLRSEPVADW